MSEKLLGAELGQPEPVNPKSHAVTRLGGVRNLLWFFKSTTLIKPKDLFSYFYSRSKESKRSAMLG